MDSVRICVSYESTAHELFRQPELPLPGIIWAQWQSVAPAPGGHARRIAVGVVGAEEVAHVAERLVSDARVWPRLRWDPPVTGLAVALRGTLLPDPPFGGRCAYGSFVSFPSKWIAIAGAETPARAAESAAAGNRDASRIAAEAAVALVAREIREARDLTKGELATLEAAQVHARAAAAFRYQRSALVHAASESARNDALYEFENCDVDGSRAAARAENLAAIRRAYEAMGGTDAEVAITEGIEAQRARDASFAAAAKKHYRRQWWEA